MERARKRIQFARERMHEAMANTVIELMADGMVDEMVWADVKKELISRWQKQEDEILASIIADVAEEQLRSQ